MNNVIILACKKVKFFSPHDEDAFFEWIKKINCITHFKGVKDTIFLSISSKNIKDEHLKDIFALFRRYKINLKQLDVFLNKRNQKKIEIYKQSFSINIYPTNS